MFITLEGPEGAGKSTAQQGIAEALRSQGHAVLCTREPGGSPIGPSIRSLLLEGQDLDGLTELFLFLADRSLHVSRVIRPALDRREIVVCDRYADSTVAYQGHARGLDVARLRELNSFATGGLVPDLMIVFDLDPQVGLARLTQPDRLDREPLEFHQKVRRGFLAEAALRPDRSVILNAELPPAELLRHALSAIEERLP